MRIAVLRGGPSKYYDKSLQTGEFVLSELRKSPRLEPVDIFISRDGVWHLEGLERTPERALMGVNLAWNCLHGEYGEDGELGGLLESLHIAHTGTPHIGLKMAYDKDLAKRVYKAHGLATPKYEVLERDTPLESVLEIFRTYLHPIFVKPVMNRRFDEVRLVQSFEELKTALAAAFDAAERVMVEEFIRGEEVLCGVLDDFRGERHYALVPTPSLEKPVIHKRIGEMAKAAHRALGLKHYSASEFVITPKGRIYIIDTNALPELGEDTAFTKSTSHIGLGSAGFVNHIISLVK